MGANTFLMVAAVSFVLLGLSSGNVDEQKTQVFQVAGKVLCQDCSAGWNEWVKAGKPIKGSLVSVTCLDDRSRVVQYESDLTDAAGNFEVTCKKFVNGKEVKPQNCYLRLVSSPDPVCNVHTNFSGGKSGVKLGRPSMVYRNIVKHVLGPFYYTSPMCDEPDTNTPYEENEEKSDESTPDERGSEDDDKKNDYY